LFEFHTVSAAFAARARFDDPYDASMTRMTIPIDDQISAPLGSRPSSAKSGAAEPLWMQAFLTRYET
jgi:hypothetical protein